jgi:hypothetical protein
MVCKVLDSGDASESIRRELAACRMAGEATKCQRLQHAKSTGDLSVNADPAGLARYIVTVIYGIAVLRRGFATPVERVDRPVLGRAWTRVKRLAPGR